MKIRATLVGLLLLSAAVTAVAGTGVSNFRGKDFFIARNGTPAATIVIAFHATAKEQQAAGELQKYIERMSGARLGIRTDDAQIGGNVIAVGRNAYSRSARGTAAYGLYPVPEEIRIKLAGSTLCVSGNDAGVAYNGTEYAVNALLEGLGCRWYMPGELGESVPAAKTVGVRALDLRYHPQFRFRNPLWIDYVSGSQLPRKMWDEQMDWMHKNRQGGIQAYSGHNFLYVLPAETMFKQHPEYFSLINGQRSPNGQVCTSNPAVVDIFVKAAIDTFDRSRETIGFSLSPSDGAGWCECQQCKAVSDYLPDRLLTFFNQVAEGVARKYPDKLLPFYVYADLTELPRKVTPNKLLLPVIAYYNFADQIHPLTANTECAGFYRNIIEGWYKLSGHIGIREYFGYGWDECPKPQIAYMRTNIPYWARNGAESCDAEGGITWGAYSLGWYLAAKLLWDPSLDVNALLDDYFPGMYAEAAGPMREYYMLMERAAARHKGPITLGAYDVPGFFGPILPGMEQCLDRAGQMARQDIVKRRIAFVRENFTYLQKYLAMRNTHDAFIGSPTPQRYEAARAAYDGLMSYADGLGQSYVINRGGFDLWTRPQLEAMAKNREDVHQLMAEQQVIMTLPELWAFSKDDKDQGETLGWFKPEFNDSRWGKLSILSVWDNQIGPYKGFGWYRVKVNIPQVPAGKQISLRFGAIDESEWVWVNGIPVGSYVFNAEQNPSSWKEPISFSITTAIKPGQDNVIVVKVGNTEGIGGIWKGASIIADK